MKPCFVCNILMISYEFGDMCVFFHFSLMTIPNLSLVLISLILLDMVLNTKDIKVGISSLRDFMSAIMLYYGSIRCFSHSLNSTFMLVLLIVSTWVLLCHYLFIHHTSVHLLLWMIPTRIVLNHLSFPIHSILHLLQLSLLNIYLHFYPISQVHVHILDYHFYSTIYLDDIFLLLSRKMLLTYLEAIYVRQIPST